MSAHQTHPRRPWLAALSLLALAPLATAADIPPAEIIEGTAGRLHPLLVHFPIALLLLAGVLEFTRWVLRRKEPSPTAFSCLVFGALGAAAAAGSGWMYALHDNPGRSVEELLEWHRWTGVVTASAALLAIPFCVARRRSDGGFARWGYRLLLTVAVLGAGGAGHLGGELMYGEGYVLEPLMDWYGVEQDAQGGAAATPDPVDAAPTGAALAAEPVDLGPEFSADVLPIFEARCFECHGERKQKGKLRLDAAAFIWGDDPSRWSILPGDSAGSAVFQRVSLPADDLDIMPAKGDPLSAEQIATIAAWIDAGARWDGVQVPVANVAVAMPDVAGAGAADSATDVLVDAAAAAAGAVDHAAAQPDAPGPLLSAPLNAARLEAVQQALVPLQERGARAMASSASTQAVEVDLSLADDVTDADLVLLRGTARALVWLNLARTGVSDSGMPTLNGLTELRTLKLEWTAVGDAGVALLANLPRLEVLNLVGTAVTDDGLGPLADTERLPALRRVYLYGSAVTQQGAAELAAARPGLHVDVGAELEQALSAIDEQTAAEAAAAAEDAEGDG